MSSDVGSPDESPPSIPWEECVGVHSHSTTSYQTPLSNPEGPSSWTASTPPSSSSSDGGGGGGEGGDVREKAFHSPTSNSSDSFLPSLLPLVSTSPLLSLQFQPRPWEGRTFSAQYKAGSVSFLCLHVVTVWDSINIVLCDGRLQLESLYGRRVVLSLPFDEVTQCTRDQSKVYKGKRARVHINNTERQWVLDLFEESQADAFYDLLSRALVTFVGKRPNIPGSHSLPPINSSSYQPQLPLLPGNSGGDSVSNAPPELSLSEDEWGEVCEGDAVESEDLNDLNLSSSFAIAQGACKVVILNAISGELQPFLEDPLTAFLQLFLVVSPFEVNRSNDPAGVLRLRLHRSPLIRPSPPPSLRDNNSSPCADDRCRFQSEVGSQFCVRHRWRDEVAVGATDDPEEEEVLTQLRFGFPTANAVVAELLQSELALRDGLLIVLEEYYQPLLQQVLRLSPTHSSALPQEKFRAIFAPFERCYAVSAALCRDLLRLSTHSALLPFAGQTLLHHMEDLRLVYGREFEFLHSIDALQAMMGTPLVELGGGYGSVTVRQWCDQRKLQWSAQTDDLLQLMRLPIGRIASYIHLVTSMEAQLPAQERRSCEEDVALVPERLRHLQSDLEKCWQELQEVAQSNETHLRTHNNERKWEELRLEFGSLSFPLVQSGRTFIQEDEVRVDGGQEGRLLLFSDLVLFAVRDAQQGLHRWQVVHRWSQLTELQVTWWPPNAERTETDPNSITFHTITAQFEVLFLTPSAANGEGRILRSDQARDRWCGAWRELRLRSMREESIATAILTAQEWLDQCTLNRQQCTMQLYPDLTNLCRWAVASLTQAVLKSQPQSETEVPVSGLWSPLTAMAVSRLPPATLSLSSSEADQQHQQLRALSVMCLLLEASLRSLAQTKEGTVDARSVRVLGYGEMYGEWQESATSFQLLVRVFSPVLNSQCQSKRSAMLVAEALLFVLFLFWRNRALAVPIILQPRRCVVALHCSSCQAVCRAALSSAVPAVECLPLFSAVLFVAGYVSLKSRSWLFQQLSDLFCRREQRPAVTLSILQSVWSTWPALLVPSLHGVRSVQCECRAVRYSKRVWKGVGQLVDTFLLTLLLYWPATAFVLHWDALTKAVERCTDDEGGNVRGHFILQQLLARTLLRAGHHPAFHPYLHPSSTDSSSLGHTSDSTISEQRTRLSFALERLFFVVLSFVLTGGALVDGPSPSPNKESPSSSSQHFHRYVLHSQIPRPNVSNVLPVPAPPLHFPPSQRSIISSVHRRGSSESTMHSRQKSTSASLNPSQLLRTESAEQQRTAGRRTEERVDVYALLDDMVQHQRSDLRLMWQSTTTGKGELGEWQLVDAPLLGLLQRTFACHPLHFISDLWLKLAPELEKLRLNRRRWSEADWRSIEERHLCAFLLAKTAAERREADNHLQTEIRGLAGTKIPALFGDMPRLNLTDTNSPHHSQ